MKFKFKCGRWFSTLRKDAQKMIDCISEPELRRTLFYDCGLYCPRCGKKPLTQIHAEHEYSIPLIKAVGIGSLALTSVGAMSLCIHWMKKTIKGVG